MFQQLLGESASPVIAFIGILAAFFLTCVSLAKGSAHLPKDQGREFAVGGALCRKAKRCRTYFRLCFCYYCRFIRTC